MSASSRSRIWRFSSSVVGSARPRSRPLVSRYVTRAPSTKISSTSRARQQLGQRTEIGDRTQHALHHRVGVAERHLLAEPRPALVVVDRALDLDVHLGELALRLQPPTLDAGDRVVADDVVGVGARRHRSRRRVTTPTSSRTPARRRGSARTTSDARASARVKRPRATGCPAHAASATRESSRDERDVDHVDARRDLVVELAAPKRRRRARDSRRRRSASTGASAAPRRSTPAAARRRPGSRRTPRRARRPPARAPAPSRTGRAAARRGPAAIRRRRRPRSRRSSASRSMTRTHLARAHLRPAGRVRDAADDARAACAARVEDRRREVAAAVLDRVDRGAQIRLERQPEPLRDRGRDVVAVDEHAPSTCARPRPRARSRSRSGRRPADRRPRRAGRDAVGAATHRAGARSARAATRASTSARTNASGPASVSITASTSTAARCARLAGSARSCTPSTRRPRACTSATNACVSAGQR